MSITAEESAWLPEEVKADKNIFFLSFLLSAGKYNNNEEQSLCLMKRDQNRSYTPSRTLSKSCEEVNPEYILLMMGSSSLFLFFYFCNLLIGKATIVLHSLFLLWVIHMQKKKEYFAHYIIFWFTIVTPEGDQNSVISLKNWSQAFKLIQSFCQPGMLL